MLRILSDLHFFDAASRVRRLEQLDPLLSGIDALVLNGDTCDTESDLKPEQTAAVTGFFNARVPAVTYVTGNHDPTISDTHELLLAGGLVWVTHGDVFFADATPWCTQQPELARRISGRLAAESAAERHTVATRLRVHREACRGLPPAFDSALTSPAARLHRLCLTLFPPRKVLAMLRAWRDTPRLAAELAAAQRPSARVIVSGHIHHAGVWPRPDGRVVVNTGTFGPPRGALVVDLDDHRLVVRRVAERRGLFHPGDAIAEFALAGPPAAALSR